MVLKLYRHYSKDCSGTIVVSQIIETQWDEETVTWEAADKFEKVRLLEQEFQFKEKDTLVEVPLDVTEALENLKESGTSELSFILELGKMSNSSSSITFASKENTNSQRKAPSLEVTISDSVKVISVDDIPEITALTGTEMDELELPEEVNAVLSDGSNMLLPVKSWSPQYSYNPDFAGTFWIEGELDLSGDEGITNPKEIKTKVKIVLVEERNKYILQVLKSEALPLIENSEETVPEASEGGQEIQALIDAYESVEQILGDRFADETQIREGYRELLEAMWNLHEADEPEEPDKPNKPEEPDEPEKPDKPEEPDKPNKPEEPDEPEEPDKPGESGETDKPEEPGRPVRPEETIKPDKPEGLVKPKRTSQSSDSEESGTGYGIVRGEVTGRWWMRNGHWRFTIRGGRQPYNQWILTGGSWYLFDREGNMMTGWVRDNRNWYYLGGDGKMMENAWVYDGKNWYYLGTGGKMSENTWIYDGKNWYYFEQDGKMAVDKTTPDGYRVNKDGQWIPEERR